MSISASNFSVDTRRAYVGPIGEIVTGTFTGPTSYSGSGETVTNSICLSAFGKRELLFINFTDPIASGATTASSGGIVSWEIQTKTAGSDQGKLHFFNAGSAALGGVASLEVAAGTNLSKYKARFMALVR